jgi:hypothetical protein
MSKVSFMLEMMENGSYWATSVEGLPDEAVPVDWLCSSGILAALRWPAGKDAPGSVRVSLSDTRPKPSEGWFPLSIDWDRETASADHFAAELLPDHVAALLMAVGGDAESCWMRIEDADEAKESDR